MLLLYAVHRKERTMKKSRLIAVILAAVLLIGCFAGCVENKDNPVIMTAGNFQMTEFDFMLAFTQDEYFNYYLYGAMDYTEYFQRILDIATQRACALNYAQKNKIELSESELADIEAQLDETMTQLDAEYLAKVDESITDENKRLEEAERLFTQDIGYTKENYREYVRSSMINSAVIQKLRDMVGEDIDLTENDISRYITDAALKLKNTTSFTDFLETYGGFVKGENTVPYLVHEDCFTVDQLLIKADDGEMYEIAAIVDELLNEGFNEDDFYEWIADYGQDENMKTDRFIDWGYIVHDSLEPGYPKGFVYAAKNLIKPTKPGFGADAPELTKFTSSDGKTVIKFESDDGIHYLILNKVFKRGIISYEQGDDIWNIAYAEAYKIAIDNAFDAKCEEWVEKTKVTYYYKKFRDKYEVPATTYLNRFNNGDDEQ